MAAARPQYVPTGDEISDAISVALSGVSLPVGLDVIVWAAVLASVAACHRGFFLLVVVVEVLFVQNDSLVFFVVVVVVARPNKHRRPRSCRRF